MPEIIAKLAGIVSYTDGSKAPFAVQLDRRGNLSYNGATGKSGSVQSIKDVDTSNNWLDLMLAQLSNLALTTTGSPAKAVSGLVAEFSGRVTIDAPDVGKPTWEDFCIQFTTKRGDNGILGASIATGSTDGARSKGTGGTSAWSKARAVTAIRTQLNLMFDQLNITVS